MSHTHNGHDGLRAIKGGKDDDYYDTESTGNYEVNKYYTRSTDSRGHKDKLVVSMSPMMLSRINQIVASRVVHEYRTPQDVIRDALVHRLKYVGDITRDQETAKVVRQEILENYLDQIIEEQEHCQELVSKAQRTLTNASARGDRAEIRKVVTMLEEAREEFSTTWHRDLDELIRRYQ